MAEKPEDLSLPASVVARIIKDALPEGVSVSKEARVAIGKAASVFILYCTACSNNLALQAKRKTLAASDVMSALSDMEFEEFIPDLKSFLEAYKRDQKGKKVAAADRRKQKAVAAAVAQSAPVSSDTQPQPVSLSSPALPVALGAGGATPSNNSELVVESGGVPEEQEELMETDTVPQAPHVVPTPETVITNVS